MATVKVWHASPPRQTETTKYTNVKADWLTPTYKPSVEDKAVNIWVSTNKGISCLVDSKDIFYNYDYHDNSPWEASVGAVAYGQDGNFYFGSINGLCYFNPEVVLQERKSPPAFITNIEITDPLNKPENGQSTIAFKRTEERATEIYTE